MQRFINNDMNKSIFSRYTEAQIQKFANWLLFTKNSLKCAKKRDTSAVFMAETV